MMPRKKNMITEKTDRLFYDGMELHKLSRMIYIYFTASCFDHEHLDEATAFSESKRFALEELGLTMDQYVICVRYIMKDLPKEVEDSVTKEINMTCEMSYSSDLSNAVH